MANPVVHFEMPYKDMKRVAEFYKKAFGWNMRETSEDMGNYVIAETTKTEGLRAVGQGEINGGFFPLDPKMPSFPSVVIAVKDIKAAMEAVKRAGGGVHGEPMDVPSVGKYVRFTDSEANLNSLLQP